MHPVGPEPASVYWRRRIIVIIGILVVLGLLAWLVSLANPNEPTAAPANSEPPSDPLPTLTSAAPTTSASPSTSVSGAACADSDITVSVTTDQQTYSVGGPVEFVMKISNTGTVPCVRDVGTLANTFVITSGGFDVWNSDACSSGDESQEEEIPAGEAFAVKGTWDGTVTANGCENATPAEAGAYQVEASNGDVVSEPVTFSLG